MHLLYTDEEGVQQEYPLPKKATSIGRSSETDLMIDDSSVSRNHCEIVHENDGFTIRDSLSKNGTYVNGERISSTKLQAGDRIRLGAVILLAEEKRTIGPKTAFMEMEKKMEEGKGYKTILKEIVNDVEKGSEDKPSGD